MGRLGKKVAFLLFIGIVCVSASSCNGGNQGEVVVVEGTNDGNSVPLQVSFSGKDPVSIEYVSSDYTGPYDPLDAKGTAAASHRALQMNAKKSLDLIQSYIPPDLDEFVKSEVMKVLKKEGQRFVFSHPKEAADLFGIYRNVKKLMKRAQNILEEENEKH